MTGQPDPDGAFARLAEIRSELARLVTQLYMTGLAADSVTINDTRGTSWSMDPAAPDTIVGAFGGPTWNDGIAVVFYQRAGHSWRLRLDEVPF